MGQGINEQFSDNPMENIFGLVSGTSSFTSFPSGTAKLLRFKAHPSNEGIFELEEADGGQDAPWPMSAGDDTGWIAPPHVEGNRRGLHDYVFRDTSGSTTNYLHYWIQR
jgi:hypothetical protein